MAEQVDSKGRPLAVGDFARNVESGWLGKITRIYNDPYKVETNGPTFDMWMAEMVGVDELARMVGGMSAEEALSSDDVEHHALMDLNRVKNKS